MPGFSLRGNPAPLIFIPAHQIAVFCNPKIALEMKQRKATAVWQGTGKEGNGHLSTQSGVLNKNQYSASSRFEEGIGTNPEELVAAAHAGCFIMKLAFIVAAAGFTPEQFEAQATVTIDSGTVTGSAIELKASVPDISDEKFEECVRDAEKNCPISKLLNTKITVDYSLNA